MSAGFPDPRPGGPAAPGAPGAATGHAPRNGCDCHSICPSRPTGAGDGVAMSDGSTVRLPIPQRPRRRRRWPWIVLASVLVLLVLLVVLDRVAVAYADNQAAQQIKSQGFPTKPNVSIEGFPFLTQVASRRLNHVHITASQVKEGPVTLSLVADATGVLLNPGYQGGTITHVTGTGLIGFSSLASAAGVTGAPGLKISSAGGTR